MTPALALLMLSAIPVPQPVNNPAEWIMTNDYPSAALRAEATGIVGFRLLIDPQGAVSDCAIIQSSGNADLDEATCRLVRQRARFLPARNEKGEGVIGSYSSRVRWTIPEDSTPLQPGKMVRSYDIERNGTITHCQVEAVSGAMSPWDKAGPLPCAEGIQFNAPIDAAGKPVRKHVIETYEIRIEGQEEAIKP